MQEVFEKIIEKLEEMIHPKQLYFCKYARGGCKHLDNDDKDCMECVVENAIEIVKQEAEQYKGGWISCSKQLPEESGEYLTWVEYDGDRFIAIDEIDCDGIIKEWNCSADYKVIAWQQLLPYQPKGE